MKYCYHYKHTIREATAAMKPTRIDSPTNEGSTESAAKSEEDNENNNNNNNNSNNNNDSDSANGGQFASADHSNTPEDPSPTITTTTSTPSKKREAPTDPQSLDATAEKKSRGEPTLVALASGGGDATTGEATLSTLSTLSTAGGGVVPETTGTSSIATSSQHSGETQNSAQSSNNSSLAGVQQPSLLQQPQQQPVSTINAPSETQQQQQQQQQQAHNSAAVGNMPQFNQQSALLLSAAAGNVPQHSQLANSILAYQQQQQQHQARLAVAGQLIANNPLMGQFYLQQLLMGAGAGATNFQALPMGLGGLGAPQMYNLGQQHNFGAPNMPGSGTTAPGQHQSSIMGQQQQQLDGSQMGQAAAIRGVIPITSLAPILNRGDGDGSRAAASSINQQQQQQGAPSLLSLGQNLTAEAIGPDVPESLPVLLALPNDDLKLSAWQVLLRNQIEAFSASSEEIATHARGRNRPITLGQVGIRCKHCKHLALNLRNKGSVYFPFSLLGLYQAAQNMGSSHFCGDSCDEMTAELKEKFEEVLTSKSTVGSGKQFWAKAAGKLGLLDTEQGIRFVRDVIAPVAT